MAAQELPESWVQPAGPVKPGLVQLSTLDNLTARVYPCPALFFPLQPNVDPRRLYEACARGLARYMHEKPHLAGIHVTDESGRTSIEVRPAPYAGGKFPYHDHREVRSMPSYSEMKKFGWPFGDGDRDGLGALRLGNFPSQGFQTGDPLLIPQFNVLRGGIVLTVCASHIIGDSVQGRDYILGWARQTNAVATAWAKGEPEPPLPDQVPANLLDRSRFLPAVQTEHDLDNLAAKATDIPNWTFLDPRDPEEIGRLVGELFTKARLTDDDLSKYSEDVLREPSMCVWAFPKESLTKLKSAVLGALGDGAKLSTVDCLTSFAWQRFFAAKWAPGLSGPGSIPETTRIVYAGSVRTRLSPPLPLNYLPACVDIFPVSERSVEAATTSPQSLARMASLVRGSGKAWSMDAFTKLLETAQMHPMNPGLIPKGPLDAFVTEHTRLHDALLESWGPDMGSCEAFREPYVGRDIPSGEITLLPTPTGDVQVMFAGEAVVMERLKRDPHMNSLASFQHGLVDVPKLVAKDRRSSVL
ncbi:hypothetical protein NLG97_g7651 [Lecanicillium saksenae]|uniref:Uncharacterized protein n=1 Tax=Lecanicillium saksenae TaxID=468837 RepID=A0ACC1QNI7_9HYPO|nr:hypothetical protein NLG97_g7651 [Lecanicillium saksenae]